MKAKDIKVDIDKRDDLTVSIPISPAKISLSIKNINVDKAGTATNIPMPKTTLK